MIKDNYCELEFEMASWVLFFWANKLSTEEPRSAARGRLVAKLPSLQRAIASGLGQGGQSYIPPEIVFDEHEVVAGCAEKLFYEIRKERDHAKAKSMLKVASVEYPVIAVCGSRECAKRPALLPANLNSMSRYVAVWDEGRERRKTPPLAEFTYWIVGQIFGITPIAVKKKLSVCRKRKRQWLATSPEQRYLVAMLLYGARLPDVSAGDLSEVMHSLLCSGYPALALYHLAKCMNKGLPQMKGTWPCSTIKAVSNYLQEQCQQGGFAVRQSIAKRLRE